MTLKNSLSWLGLCLSAVLVVAMTMPPSAIHGVSPAGQGAFTGLIAK